MGNFWCVTPETDRLELEALGRPFWIDVVRELTVGEQRQVDTGGFRGGVQGAEGQRAADRQTEIAIDWKAQSFARSEVYIKDWSLADDKGNKLPIKRATIEALRQPVFQAIEDGLTKHIETQAALRKNAPSGDAGPRAISA